MRKDPYEYGYGVVKDGKLIVRTISDTRAHAATNGLVLLLNATIGQNATPKQILDAWNHYERRGFAKIVRVHCVALLHVTDS